jgi:hypothetical protein
MLDESAEEAGIRVSDREIAVHEHRGSLHGRLRCVCLEGSG